MYSNILVGYLKRMNTFPLCVEVISPCALLFTFSFLSTLYFTFIFAFFHSFSSGLILSILLSLFTSFPGLSFSFRFSPFPCSPFPFHALASLFCLSSSTFYYRPSLPTHPILPYLTLPVATTCLIVLLHTH